MSAEPNPVPEARLRSLARNVASVRARVARAAAASGRDADSVRIVAVTKTFDLATTAALFALGCRDLGENRPEALVVKAEAPGLESAVWHLIGTFQRRKVRDSLRSIALVHSVTSLPLLLAIDARARALGRVAEVLIETNLAGEATKQGLSADGARAAIDAAADLSGVRVSGLMSMAPPGLPSAELRRLFASVRELRDALATQALPLPELSMGMSGDFEEAIAEGATIVRIGSAFGEDSDG